MSGGFRCVINRPPHVSIPKASGRNGPPPRPCPGRPGPPAGHFPSPACPWLLTVLANITQLTQSCPNRDSPPPPRLPTPSHAHTGQLRAGCLGWRSSVGSPGRNNVTWRPELLGESEKLHTSEVPSQQLGGIKHVLLAAGILRYIFLEINGPEANAETLVQ